MPSQPGELTCPATSIREADPISPCAERYSLLLLDLDGTTLRTGSEISSRTVDAVQQALRLGTRVCLASARPPRSMWKFHQELGLATPMICYNGALIVDADGSTLFSRSLPIAAARAAVSFLRKRCPTANLSLECEDFWHIDRVDDDLREALILYRLDPPHTEGQLDALLASNESSVSKVVAAAGNLAQVAREEIERATRGDACVVESGALIEITASGVSKGAAAADLCVQMQITPDAVVAFGDQLNDIPMLEFAGLGVAMANAPEPVRRVADRVAPTNDDDGVALVIEDLIASGKLQWRR